jgi:hypothetical protein
MNTSQARNSILTCWNISGSWMWRLPPWTGSAQNPSAVSATCAIARGIVAASGSAGGSRPLVMRRHCVRPVAGLPGSFGSRAAPLRDAAGTPFASLCAGAAHLSRCFAVLRARHWRQSVSCHASKCGGEPAQVHRGHARGQRKSRAACRRGNYAFFPYLARSLGIGVNG